MLFKSFKRATKLMKIFKMKYSPIILSKLRTYLKNENNRQWLRIFLDCNKIVLKNPMQESVYNAVLDFFNLILNEVFQFSYSQVITGQKIQPSIWASSNRSNLNTVM